MKIALIQNLDTIVKTQEVADATNLFRKGWVEVEEDKPVFNPDTEELVLISSEIVTATRPVYTPQPDLLVDMGEVDPETGEPIMVWEPQPDLVGEETYPVKVIERYAVQASSSAVYNKTVNDYLAKVATGYDTTLGFNLGVQESDRSQFTQMLVLLNSAQVAGYITDDTPQTISDINGNVHNLTTAQFKQLILGYGLYCKGLWDEMKQISSQLV